MMISIALLALGGVSDVQARHRNVLGVGSLNEAYTELAGARPVYYGHRLKAMGHVQAAATKLGGKVNYRGKLCDPHAANSDGKLRAAQGILREAKSGMPAASRTRVKSAISEISTALSLREHRNNHRGSPSQRTWNTQPGRDRQGSWADQL
jgi:hypothetical protein